MRPLVGFCFLLLGLGSWTCAERSTAPDPNAAMYGTWSGVLLDSAQTQAGLQPRQFALQLQFGPGGVLPTIDGSVYASAVELMHDPDVDFLVRRGSRVSGFSGTRTGDTLSGKTGWISLDSGNWRVVRLAMPGGSR